MDVAGSDTAAAAARGGSRKSYDAFISYAHGGDEAFAPVVQRGLQRLAKPWNRRRAMEVFRDETSLAVSPGLWPSIRDALDASRWFVLLASPEAAGSQWVGEEITHWVSSKGTDYLLVVVTDGTWIWDDDIADVSPASTACNPELRGVFRTEPKYLDMTWARRNAGLTLRNARFRDQIATLAAAIRGVPKEEIEGEDVRQQRRIRRIVRAVIAALTVLVVLASASAVVANVQRQQALYQRDVAISDELATNSEAIGETNATVSQLESIAAWGIHHSAQARYAMLSAAASPESSTFTVSSGAVFSVAFSPDGKMLATGDDHGTVLWDLATGRQIRSFSASFGAVNSVAFSPDGKMLATGDDHGTVLWDLATGRQIHSFPTGSAAVVSTAFTPDGKMLAIGLFSGTVQLRNVATGQQSRSFPGPDAIDSLALSPDSQMLVTGGLTARLWDLATGRQIRAFSAGSDVVGSVAFSPDGKILATGDADGTARLWNPDTGRQIGSSFTGVGAVESVAFSPDGKTLAIGGNDGTVLWNLGTGRQVSSFTSLGAVESVAFSPDGKTLATGDNDGTARVWDLAADRQIGRFAASQVGRSSVDEEVLGGSVAFSPDGKTLAIGGTMLSISATGVISGGVGSVELWNLATGQQLRTLPVGSDAVYSVAFSRDGKMLATGEGDGTARLWNVATGRQIRILPAASNAFASVDSVAFSPDGKMLATGEGDGTARLWNVATGRQIRILPAASNAFASVDSVAFSPDGRMLATGDDSDGTARLWDLATGRPIRGLPTGSSGVYSVAFSPDGQTLATGDDDGTARLWDLATGQQLRTLTTGSDLVWSVAFSRDGQTLATGDDDGTARLWDLVTGQQIGSPLTSSGPIHALAFSPDGMTLATEDGPVGLWNVGYLVNVIARLCSQVGGSLTQAEWTQYVPPGPSYRDVCGLQS